MGQCQQWELHCSVYFDKGAHEYPVLDRCPGSNVEQSRTRLPVGVRSLNAHDKAGWY